MEEIITYRPAFRPPIQQPATALLYSSSQVPSSSSCDEDDNCDDENDSRESTGQEGDDANREKTQTHRY